MKMFLTLTMLICLTVAGYSQNRFVDRHIQSDVMDKGAPAPFKGPFSYYTERGGDYPGAIPNAASYFDYMTNGSNLSYIWVYGDTVLVSYFGADSLDPLGANSRVGYYVVSYNGGTTWGTPVALTTLPQRSAYTELHPFLLSGTRNVSLSGRQYTSPGPGASRGGAWVDAFLGLGSFTQEITPIGGLDYFGHYLNNNKLGGIHSVTGDSLFFIKFDLGTGTHDVSTRRLIATPPSETNTNVRYRMTADETGNNLFGMWYITDGAGAVSMGSKTSTDGGNTWGSLQTLQSTTGFNKVVNGDTCSAWFGMDAAIKPGTTVPYAVWSTLYPTGTGQSSGDNQGTKIVLWSPAVNGGNLVEVAGKINMNIISDTSLFFLQDSSQVGVTPVSHPSIAFAENGTIIVAFSAFQPTNVFQNYNYNDIYITYSSNGGTTWATPKNITNTPDWDELYPSVSETGISNVNDVHIKYIANRVPGSQSFTNNRPVSKVFHVYNHLTNVSIQNVSNEVPDGFSLKQNYPNPFNPTTSIRFDIKNATTVSLKVYNVTGKQVATLVNNEKVTAGVKEVTFDAASLSSGIYFYTLTSAEGFSETKKMMLVK